MSAWDQYRDNLVASGNFAQVAICGLTDGATWSTSPGLTVSPSEALTFTRGFNDASVLHSGIYIGGTKYMFIKATSDEIQGKKGPAGVSIAKTNLCILIGLYKEGMQPGAAAYTLGKMQDHLKSVNY